jgi:hypothetical protein
MGVAIEVEPDGPLFHQLKTAPIDGYDRNKNCLDSREVQAMAADPAVLSVADTLHVVTGSTCLAPSAPAVQRVAAMKGLATQLEINRSHGMPNLPTTHPSTPLPAESVRVVERAGNEVWKHWYRPASHDGERVEDGVASAAAGELGRRIAEFLRTKQSGSERDAKLALKLGQFQRFIAAFPQECMGQLASFWANLTPFWLQLQSHSSSSRCPCTMGTSWRWRRCSPWTSHRRASSRIGCSSCTAQNLSGPSAFSTFQIQRT